MEILISFHNFSKFIYKAIIFMIACFLFWLGFHSVITSSLAAFILMLAFFMQINGVHWLVWILFGPRDREEYHNGSSFYDGNESHAQDRGRIE